MEVRINKYLATVGVGARRKADEMIAAGKVRINGKTAKLGAKIDPQKDKVEVSGKVVGQVQEKVYIALNKPKDVVSTVIDTHGRRTVVDLVNFGKKLFPVGRLDQESEGLMLLTNDGDLAFKLTHPKFHIEKTYEVWVKGRLGPETIGRLAKGVKLEDGMTAPAKVRILKETEHNTLFEIILSQGKNRQIRRMCEALHLHITGLKRVSIGLVRLGDLQIGKWRYLTDGEVSMLKGKIKSSF